MNAVNLNNNEETGSARRDAHDKSESTQGRGEDR
jgi:hypothetical protein